MNKKITVHTSRTMMFAELSKVMDYVAEDDTYLDSLHLNITNKKTKSNQDKTTGFLQQLYGFDLKEPSFLSFKYFWQIAEAKDKPVLTLLYAIGRDYLLAESYPVVASTNQGEKVTIEKLEETIDSYHPKRYTDNTKRSLAQNIASSWKQAGFITGKVKNIRTQPDIGYAIVAFAFLMAYLNGERGDFILTSIWSKALCLGENQLRELANEASKRDLLQYQYAGNITSISFTNLLNQLDIDGI